MRSGKFVAGCAMVMAALVPVVGPGPVPATGAVVPQGAAVPYTKTPLSADGRLWELTVSSPAVGTPTKARLLLPAGYDPAGTTEYPVLYLLHGGGGNETDWSIKGDAAALTAAYDVIVIMPYGTDASLWTNWYNDGDSSVRQYETHHLVELRDILEQDYRANGGYAVAGLSSGGFGALSYAARHPDMFSAMLSMSGSQDRNYHDVSARRAIDGFSTVSASGGPLYGYWGGPVTQEVRWRDHNPIDLAPNLEGVKMDVTWGNGLPGPLVDSNEILDPIETAVIEPNEYLMARFAELENRYGKDLDYHNGYYGNGSHHWTYWQRELTRTLPMIMTAIGNGPRSTPAKFTYRTAEERFEVWDWEFQTADRDRRVFSEVKVNRKSPTETVVKAIGNGTLHVTSPATFTPGAAYEVDGATVTADAAGRLRFDLDVGDSSFHFHGAIDLEPIDRPWAYDNYGSGLAIRPFTKVTITPA